MELEKYRRIARALAESQRLNAELNARVQQKQAELERQFDTLQRLSREAAVAEERQRIMADMHDGIGAQLISTLSLVEGGGASTEQVAGALRECIDDLRLAIDSLEPADNELLPVLGNLRYRLEPRLKAQGIALDWKVADVPRLSCLTPRNVLQVLRVLQEALSNVLKHAQASRVRVVTEAAAGCVAIDISDNGRGFAESEVPAGRGLANMRRRAQAIGGELLVRSSGEGTTVSLHLPADGRPS
jgi:signal transduction histidine kinase